MPHKKGATGIRSRTRTRAAGRAANRPRIKGCTARRNTRQASRRSAQLDENSVLSLRSVPDKTAAVPAVLEALAFPTNPFLAAFSAALSAALPRLLRTAIGSVPVRRAVPGRALPVRGTVRRVVRRMIRRVVRRVVRILPAEALETICYILAGAPE